MDQRNDTKVLPPLPRLAIPLSRFKSKLSRLIYGWWVWEVAAVAVSSAATVALIALLKRADSREQQPWVIGPFELTLNTVLTIISTIIRAALMVLVTGALSQSSWNSFASKKSKGSEQSSQRIGRLLADLDLFGEAVFSSWGSLKLLYRARFRQWASLGALLTILSLAFDAFAQQFLAAETRMEAGRINDPTLLADSIIPRALSYTKAGLIRGSKPNSSLMYNTSLPLPASAAVMNGIIDPNVPQLLATCSTGNCTWPMTPTLAICAACFDFKDRLIARKIEDEKGWTYRLRASSQDSRFDMTFNWTFAFEEMFFLKARSTTEVLEKFGINLPSGRQTIFIFYAIGVPPPLFSDFTNQDPPLPHYGKRPHKRISLNQTYAESYLVAYNCSFSICLQSHGASSSSGRSNSEALDSWDQMIETGPNPFNVRGALNRSQVSWSFRGIPPPMNVGNASAYMIDAESRCALQRTLERTLTGTVGSTGPDSQPFFKSDPSASISEGATVESTAIEGIWAAANTTESMNAIVQKFADSFTNYMRTNFRAPPDSRYMPTTYGPAIFVRVRWLWLMYPLSLLLAGYVFLAAKLIQTHRRAVLPWKNQRLPLLLADTDDIIREFAAGGLHRRNGLDKRVGRMQVLMDFDGKDQIAFRRA